MVALLRAREEPRVLVPLQLSGSERRPRSNTSADVSLPSCSSRGGALRVSGSPG